MTRFYGWTCPTCVQVGWRGYCAALACRCGHPECSAYPSWRPARRLHAVPDPKEKP